MHPVAFQGHFTCVSTFVYVYGIKAARAPLLRNYSLSYVDVCLCSLVQVVDILSGYFDIQAFLFLGLVRFSVPNKILVTHSVKTMCNFCYFTKRERFWHFFWYFHSSSVLIRFSKKLLVWKLFVIKFSTEVDLKEVSNFNSLFTNDR